MNTNGPGRRPVPAGSYRIDSKAVPSRPTRYQSISSGANGPTSLSMICRPTPASGSLS